MCLAIPGQIREIDGTRARVEIQGNFITADLSLVDEPALDDWVLVHAGFAIEKLDPVEAHETLSYFDTQGA